MLRDVEVPNTPPVVTNDQEAVENAERDGGNCEEVHCSDDFPMVPDKSHPPFGRLGLSGSAPHPARDRSLGNIKTEHEKLAVDARCSPGRVFCDHTEDQVSHFFGKPLPADRPSHPGNQPPVQTETGPVPADDGLRSDDDQRVFPCGPKPLGDYPEQFVEDIQPWSRMATLEHRELLPERHSVWNLPHSVSGEATMSPSEGHGTDHSPSGSKK
jgi:hypothetical protein